MLTKYPSTSSKKKLLNMQRIEEFVRWYKRMPSNQKTSFITMAFLALVVPASVAATLNEVRSRSNAYTPLSEQGNRPAVITNSLPTGTANSTYRAQVEGMDAKAQETVILSAVGLPPGLTLTNCNSDTISENLLTCEITGTPTQPGSFDVELTVKNSQGISTTKTIWITIRPQLFNLLPISTP